MNVQSDGKIVVGGEATSAGLLARYAADGSYDNSFGPLSGKNYLTSTLSGYDGVTFIETALRADDGIVTVGRFYSFNNWVPAVGIAVFDRDGHPVPLADASGVITATAGTHVSSSYALLVQLDGRVVVAGNADVDDTPSGRDTDLALWRFFLGTQRIYLPVIMR